MLAFDLMLSLPLVLILTSSRCTGYDRQVMVRWGEHRAPINTVHRLLMQYNLPIAQERQDVSEFNIPSETVVLQDHPQFLEDLSGPKKPSGEESVGTFQRIMNFLGFQNEPDPSTQQKKRKIRRRPQVTGHPFIPGHTANLVQKFPLSQSEVPVSQVRLPRPQIPVPDIASGAVFNMEPVSHKNLRNNLPPLSPTAQIALAQKLRSQLTRQRPASFSKIFKAVVYDHYPPSYKGNKQLSNSPKDKHFPDVLSSSHPEFLNGQSSQNEVLVSSQAHLHKRDAGLAGSTTPKNFITPQPLNTEQFSQQILERNKASDLIIGSLMSFGESAAIVFPEPQPKTVPKKPERALPDVSQVITFPSDSPPHDAVTRDFNKTRATGGDKCVLENGQAFHAGSCSLLLTQAACLENHWLVLRQDGTPICAHRRCPWRTLYYTGDCVDPADQSVCGVGQMLYVHLTGESECDCDPNHYYDPSTDKCYAEHEQSFCKDSFYIELTADQKVECVPNPCHQDGLIQVDGRCYKKEYDGVCPRSQIMFVPETGSAECMQIIPHSIFGVGIQTACPSGSKRGFLGRCRSVFRMPTQRTFPKQRGVCPSSFSGGVKNSCRRTIGLFG
ncbi:protein of unknown function DUF4789 [Trinorchestia longiramus]|nr:protein of unknown function DUF4789 [Trinorchestia longiramus]